MSDPGNVFSSLPSIYWMVVVFPFETETPFPSLNKTPWIGKKKEVTERQTEELRGLAPCVLTKKNHTKIIIYLHFNKINVIFHTSVVDRVREDLGPEGNPWSPILWHRNSETSPPRNCVIVSVLVPTPFPSQLRNIPTDSGRVSSHDRSK